MSWMGIMRSHWTMTQFRTGLTRTLLVLPLLAPMSIVSAAQAQVTPTQVAILVEAFRDIAKQSTSKPKTLHSDWRISERNIGPWSKQCLQRELTPQDFDRDPETVTKIVTCVVNGIFKTEYQTANNDEALAIRRVSSWWRTGDANTYEIPETVIYADRILKAYQKRNGGKAFATNSGEKSSTSSIGATPVEMKVAEKKPVNKITKPTEAKKIATIVPVSAGRSTVYDRYMQAGYQANEKKDSSKALLFFRRALDERPNDNYATTAIQNTESK
ncbi:MAG: hypothetical protein LH631_00350 [Alkalinema sp. CAN_BIN05]|nr:hypothetical protein [Alkalinema sp. CAN_BIN05]